MLRGRDREFGQVMNTWLYLKWITNKDLLYSTWNSAQCYVAAWMGEEFGGEWIRVYVYMCVYIHQFSSVAQSCPTLCDPTNRSTPGLPVHHQLPEFTQTHVHRVSDAIQPSHPLLSPSPPAPNPSQHQSHRHVHSPCRRLKNVTLYFFLWKL